MERALDLQARASRARPKVSLQDQLEIEAVVNTKTVKDWNVFA